MPTLKDFKDRKPKQLHFFLWIIAFVLTILCLIYQDKTGPTKPLTGHITVASETVRFKFMRSATIGRNLKIMLIDPIPENVTGFVKYRRFKSNDDWATMPMKKGEFQTFRRGQTRTITGMGAELPGLQECAGKYEFYVYIAKGETEPFSVTGNQPIDARYKAPVPHWALSIHIVTIFLSMLFAIRTLLEAILNSNFKWMLWATFLSLLIGGFVFGPLVQWYAFGVWWSGIPFGHDWTDNKVLVELLFWIIALITNWGSKRNRKTVYIAGLMTLIVYLIPHSLFGSEYNYTIDSGHGTTG